MICTKADPELIKSYQKNTDFDCFELYLKDISWLNKDVPVDKICAVHQASRLMNGEIACLTDEKLGEMSEEEYKKTIKFCKENGIKKIIVHPGHFNALEKDKK
jgi:endonuclease IV